MKSLWNDEDAARYLAEGGELGLRVYTSRLLGMNPDLVLHGGGNTSLKGVSDTVFGESVETLFVKGSGVGSQDNRSGRLPACRSELLAETRHPRQPKRHADDARTPTGAFRSPSADTLSRGDSSRADTVSLRRPYTHRCGSYSE